jgi:DNA-binding transcriptional LysR family regulator
VNHATIARRLHSLEDSLGEKLVERRPEGFVLTLAGTHTLAVASDMDSASRTLGRAGPDNAPKGLVRVNAPPALTHGYLIAKLSKMAAAYPGLDIELATDVRSISLERHYAYIAVGVGRPADGDVIAKPVATSPTASMRQPKCAHGWQRVRSRPTSDSTRRTPTCPKRSGCPSTFLARDALCASSQFAQGIAARSGVGVALLPFYIGRAESSLRRCDLGPVPAPREVFVVRRRQNTRTMRVNVVVDCLVSVFKEDRAVFEDEVD